MNKRVAQARPPIKSLWIGGVILVVGFLSPLCIPWVLESPWSDGVKTVLTGLLAFGIPELFMLIAVAVMGKQGYQYMKERASKWITRISPDRVSITRYRFGLVLFTLPLILGFLQPYLGHFFPFLAETPLFVTMGLDFLLLVSLFVLGGEFWEKLKGLFNHDIIATKRTTNQ